MHLASSACFPHPAPQISVCRSQRLTALSRKTLASLGRCVNLLPALHELVATGACAATECAAFVALLATAAIPHRLRHACECC